MLVLMSVLAATLAAPLDQAIVTPAWLEQNLNDPNVIVLEIGSVGPARAAEHTVSAASWPHGSHAHIPGARFIPIEAIVQRNAWPLDELPPVDQLRQVFSGAGVGDTGRIVIYSSKPLWATRAWFTLDALGHGDRAAILDGGFARWQAEKRPVRRRWIDYAAQPFTPHFDASRVIARAGVAAMYASPDVVLIDARPKEQFNGRERGSSVKRAGHIPNAHCVHWRANLAKNGSFLPAADLSNQYAELAGAPGKRVVVYCRTGMEASMPYFVLRSLGYDVALYDGSYTEWSRDRAVPVTTLSMNP